MCCRAKADRRMIARQVAGAERKTEAACPLRSTSRVPGLPRSLGFSQPDRRTWDLMSFCWLGLLDFRWFLPRKVSA